MQDKYTHRSKSKVQTRNDCWQLQEAKAKFSELIKASHQGPQTIIVEGIDEAVILSKQDYDNLINKKGSFWDFMRASPLVGENLDVTRDKY